MGTVFVRLMSWFVSKLRAFTANGKRRAALVADGRKVAVGTGIAGLVGLLSDHASVAAALVMVVSGLVIWFLMVGLIRDDDDDHKGD